MLLLTHLQASSCRWIEYEKTQAFMLVIMQDHTMQVAWRLILQQCNHNHRVTLDMYVCGTSDFCGLRVVLMSDQQKNIPAMHLKWVLEAMQKVSLILFVGKMDLWLPFLYVRLCKKLNQPKYTATISAATVDPNTFKTFLLIVFGYCTRLA